MFFSKKRAATKGYAPVDEVRMLTKRGMSDKDIIRRLKKEGFAGEEIEKGMIEAVKAGVGGEARGPEESFFNEPSPMQLESKQRAPPTFEEMYGKEEPVDVLETFASAEDIPKPEVIIEELVEGVVNEKWQKFEDKLTAVKNEFNNIRVEMKQFEHRLKTAHPGQSVDDSKIREMTEQLDDLAARVGGLEKAFKQFLPSLTKNIEALSEMIHEMKGKEERELSYGQM